MADLRTKTKTLMNERRLMVMGAAAQGVRRTAEESPASLPLPDPEVAATAKRRQFSSREKRRILAAADRCTKAGEIGALLRREGIYSSARNVSTPTPTSAGSIRTWDHPIGLIREKSGWLV